MGKFIWYLHLEKHHKQFQKLKCRSDVCTYCPKYDTTILPMLRRGLERCVGGVRSVQEDYFEISGKD